MRRTTYRVLWGVAGVLLIIAGIMCLVWRGAALATLAMLLGVVLLISGVVDIIIFCSARNVMYGAAWFLVDGILTVILSLFILFDQVFTMLTLPFVFGMWLICTGITRFVNSFDLQRCGVRGWGWFTALGLLMTAAGVISFIDPVAGAMALGIVLGISLILEGIAAILRACFAGRFWI